MQKTNAKKLIESIVAALDVLPMFSVRYADKQSPFAFYELSEWPLNRQVIAIIDSI